MCLVVGQDTAVCKDPCLSLGITSVTVVAPLVDLAVSVLVDGQCLCGIEEVIPCPVLVGILEACGR